MAFINLDSKIEIEEKYIIAGCTVNVDAFSMDLFNGGQYFQMVANCFNEFYKED